MWKEVGQFVFGFEVPQVFQEEFCIICIFASPGSPLVHICDVHFIWIAVAPATEAGRQTFHNAIVPKTFSYVARWVYILHHFAALEKNAMKVCLSVFAVRKSPFVCQIPWLLSTPTGPVPVHTGIFIGIDGLTCLKSLHGTVQQAALSHACWASIWICYCVWECQLFVNARLYPVLETCHQWQELIRTSLTCEIYFSSQLYWVMPKRHRLLMPLKSSP